MKTTLNDALKTNQTNVLSYIQEVASAEPNFPAPGTFRELAKNSLEGQNPDYAQAILNLNKQRDLNNGIVWHEDKENHIVVRDARGSDKKISNGYEAYAIQYLNSIRATKALLENDGKLTPGIARALDQKARDFLRTVSSDNYPNTEKANAKTIKEANKDLLDFYSKKSGVDKKTAKKQLNTAKDFANFEDTHNHVVTLSNIQHNDGETYTIFEAEVALVGLTDQQKAQYQAIVDHKTDPKNNPLPDWYGKLPKWEQKLVDRYVDKITDGQHVIPTQLRNNTVGIRNAYNKVTGIIDPEGNAKPLHQTFHGGTVSAQTKGDNQKIANMNVEQFSQFAGKPVHCVTLNTPHNPTGNDKDIVNQTAKATKSNGHSHSNFAFNALRRVGPNKSDGTKEMLDSISDGIDNRSVSRYINGKSSNLKRAGQEIDKLKTNDDTKTVLKLALELRQLVDNNKSPIDPENRNLQITTLVSRINDRLNHGEIDTKVIDTSKVKDAITVFMCQSGKDRTGVQLFNTTSEVIGAELERISGIPVDKKEVQKTIANNGHTQQMAGFQGGSMGCMGVKSESISGMSESWGKDVHHTLSQKTASFNKFKTTEGPGFFQRLGTAIKKAFGFGSKETPMDIGYPDKVEHHTGRQAKEDLIRDSIVARAIEKSPEVGISQPFNVKKVGGVGERSDINEAITDKFYQDVEEHLGVSTEKYRGEDRRQGRNAPLREMANKFPPEDRESLRSSIQEGREAEVQKVGEGKKVTKEVSGINEDIQKSQKVGKA